MIEGEVTLHLSGRIECWEPLIGARREVPARTTGDGVTVALHLPQRESVVLVVDPQAEFIPGSPVEYDEQRLLLDLPWQVCAADGEPVPGLALGDWSQHPGLELFSGTLCYRAQLEIPDPGESQVGLDVDAVGDIAEVILDGTPVGVRMWAPYEVLVTGPVAAGPHKLEVRVTNSMANAYEGAQRPSGLMGPVQLILRRHRPT